MASVENFTEEEDEILITLVSQHPLLYDLSKEDYKNIRKKEKVWSDIAVQLNKRSDRCKKHWKNLKDTYLRQKRKNKRGTDSAAPKNPRSKFGSYAKLFSFLDIVPNERFTISNIDPDEITTEVVQNERCTASNTDPEEVTTQELQLSTQVRHTATLISPATSAPPFPKSNRKRTKKNDILSYLQKKDASRHRILENVNKKREDDELVSFSEHVKAVLKKLTPLRKLQAKKDIFDILIKYELLHVESEIESNCPGTSSSYASSNNSVNCTTPEPQDAPANSTHTQYALYTQITSDEGNF